MRCFVVCLLCCSCLAIAAGCTSARSSDTSRTGMEQLLISNAVDRSLDKVDFRPFANHRVFLDEKRLECTDEQYVVSSIRHRLFHAGAALVSSAEEADVVLEPRSGGVGTDRIESFVGVPEIAAPGPVPLAIPEIQIFSRKSQTATAKLALVAYDPETGRAFGQGGTSLAKSDDNNWFFLGMGPVQNGTVRSELRERLRRDQPAVEPLPTQIAFDRGNRPAPFAEPESGRVRLTGADEEPFPEPSPRRTDATPERSLPR